MFKKEFGISIYPEHSSIKEIENYLISANSLGFKSVFLSLIHLSKIQLNQNISKYKDTFALCKKYNFYIILDIVNDSLNYLNDDLNNLSKIHKFGINCLRLDSPLLAREVSHATRNKFGIDIQVNASNNDNFITNIMDFKPMKEHLNAGHNFYPLKNTALMEDFFLQSTKRFYDVGLQTSAFIGSHVGIHGPQNQNVGPLSSLEIIRDLNSRTQAKYMLSTEMISKVIFGNFMANLYELTAVGSLLNEWNKIVFDIKINKKISKEELNILTFDYHFRRGDITDHFIRSTLTRQEFKDYVIKPDNTKLILNKGDICIINNKNKHYQSELLIILKDDYRLLGDSVNWIGNIGEEKILLQFVKPWTEFKFKII